MSDINIIRPYILPLKIAKARVQKLAGELGSEHGLRSAWEGNILRFDRAGLHGEMEVTESEIRLQVNLSLLLKPLRAQLISRIEDKFDRLFPQVQAGAPATKPGKKTES